MLPKAINISIGRDTAFNADILIFEDNWRIDRKEDFLGWTAKDGERKRIGCVTEANDIIGSRIL